MGVRTITDGTLEGAWVVVGTCTGPVPEERAGVALARTGLPAVPEGTDRAETPLGSCGVAGGAGTHRAAEFPWNWEVAAELFEGDGLAAATLLCAGVRGTEGAAACPG